MYRLRKTINREEYKMDWKDLSNQTNIELLLHKRISHKKLVTMSEIKSIYQEFDLRIRNILDTVYRY